MSTATAVRERPILMSGPMVRAILDGRKTQTRRVVKLPHVDGPGEWETVTLGGGSAVDRHGQPVPPFPAIAHSRTGTCIASPFKPGLRLWVRETWAGVCSDEPPDSPHLVFRDVCPTWPDGVPIDGGKRGHWTADYIVYRADSDFEWDDETGEGRSNWRPSIHMPRWASRLTLEVTCERVQLLSQISQHDADAEGIFEFARANQLHMYPTTAFARLWDQINGKRVGCSWDDNPFVWVVEFKPT